MKKIVMIFMIIVLTFATFSVAFAQGVLPPMPPIPTDKQELEVYRLLLFFTNVNNCHQVDNLIGMNYFYETGNSSYLAQDGFVLSYNSIGQQIWSKGNNSCVDIIPFQNELPVQVR